ncbi:MAG: hypothetical protein JRE28_10335 [Deltaproteobacteria bacterium]|nr:hypothetical protein [Deltaproteobacteria bacterium]
MTSNGGKVAVPGALSADPVHATGQTATDAVTGGDHTLTVVGGRSYLVMATNVGNFIFGILTVATAANIAWMCPKNQAIVINMPEGETSLHYMSDTNDGVIYLTELHQNPGSV